MKQSQPRGLTLLEMIITISLFSLVMLGTSQSIIRGMSAWKVSALDTSANLNLQMGINSLFMDMLKANNLYIMSDSEFPGFPIMTITMPVQYTLTGADGVANQIVAYKIEKTTIDTRTKYELYRYLYQFNATEFTTLLGYLTTLQSKSGGSSATTTELLKLLDLAYPSAKQYKYTSVTKKRLTAGIDPDSTFSSRIDPVGTRIGFTLWRPNATTEPKNYCIYLRLAEIIDYAAQTKIDQNRGELASDDKRRQKKRELITKVYVRNIP